LAGDRPDRGALLVVPGDADQGVLIAQQEQQDLAAASNHHPADPLAREGKPLALVGRSLHLLGAARGRVVHLHHGGRPQVDQGHLDPERRLRKRDGQLIPAVQAGHGGPRVDAGARQRGT
jgi:hypothetical protein